MITPEERRQRILANQELRLAKLRQINASEQPSDIPPMAPVSTTAPEYLLKKVDGTPAPQVPIVRPTPNPPSSSTLISSISSATSMMSSFSSLSTAKATVEVTNETITVDQQHILIAILGMITAFLYAFHLSSDSNAFFVIYVTCYLCICTSRYVFMQMKHRNNVVINTLMLSGFKPQLVKKLILVYTLVCDAWVLFAFYFVPFCLTHVLCSLFSHE